jgi:hypothetical protein
MNAFIERLATTLDPKALAKFGRIERLVLARAMEACGMTEYPPLAGRPEGERACGSMICPLCNRDYFSHPMDWRVIGYGDVPFLNVLCDGRRVKL